MHLKEHNVATDVGIPTRLYKCVNLNITVESVRTMTVHTLKVKDIGIGKDHIFERVSIESINLQVI